MYILLIQKCQRRYLTVPRPRAEQLSNTRNVSRIDLLVPKPHSRIDLLVSKPHFRIDLLIPKTHSCIDLLVPKPHYRPFK
jgi:hypothetical protein